MMQKLHVILAAAGSSRRMQNVAQINKPYMMLEGRPVLAHSLTFFEALPFVEKIVIVAARDEVDFCREEVVEKFHFHKVLAITPGGKERQQSIFEGLKAFKREEAPQWVAVHDSARPFLDQALCVRLFEQVQKKRAVVPGVLVKDTMKQVDAAGWVENTPPRAQLRAIQTPQMFAFPALFEAYQRAEAEGFLGTDDAMLYEKYIGKVWVEDTTWDNTKITTPQDWAWAQYRMKNWM